MIKDYTSAFTGSGGTDSISGSNEDTDTEETFKTGEDTFSVTDFGATQESGDTETQTVVDTTEPGDSSPSGGAGFTEATSRFLDVSSNKVSQAIEKTNQATVGKVVEKVANTQINSDKPLPDTTPKLSNMSSWTKTKMTTNFGGGDGILPKGLPTGMTGIKWIVGGFITLVAIVTAFKGNK